MAKRTLSLLGLTGLLPPGTIITSTITEDEATKTKKPRAAKKPKEPEIDWLNQPCSSFKVQPTSITVVPNEFPTLNQPYRIAVIGEAPGRDEEIAGKPFVGMSGQLLTNLLSKAGVLRQACFIGNISQHRPQDNDINLADPIDLQEGIEQLTKDLDEYNPNICLLLGNTPLRLAKDDSSIGSWRGSYFVSNKAGPFSGRKCIAAYHPAACLRNYEWMPLLMFDIIKCSKEATRSTLELPNRNLITTLSADEIITKLQSLQQSPRKISIDIEGRMYSMSCISIAESPFDSFIIPFSTSNGGNYWTQIEDELGIWNELSKVLVDSQIEKTLQNGLYDRFILQYCYNLIVCNHTEDTLVKSWELYCELPKDLGFLCSLFTREPFYKHEIDSNDLHTFWRYCCRDSAVTYEIESAITPMLPAPSREHYKFNMELMNLLLYLEIKGIRYDIKKAQEKLEYVNSWIYRYQLKLDILTNSGFTQFTGKSRQDVITAVKQVMCFVRDQSKPKKDFVESFPKVIGILSKETELTEEDLGYISIECDWSLNVKSDKFKTYLYETLQLPEQRSKIENDDGEKPITADAMAMLKLKKLLKDDSKLSAKLSPELHARAVAVVDTATVISELRTRKQTLGFHPDEDGRMRSAYNGVGTETGRTTCKKSPTGSGSNAQTVPDDYESYTHIEGFKENEHPLRYGLRDLYCADSGYHMAQCDLKGSDGWTIGANMASLGDPSMLDDLRFGIKPAQRCCYMLRHGNGSLMRKPREEVKELLKEVKKTDWDYFALKVGIWGLCYLMGPDLLAEVIADESQGKLWYSRKDIELFRNAVFSAYNVKLWHNSLTTRLAKSPRLLTPSGHLRRFFSRKADILGQALAHEPQAVTTYATNLAALRLWKDPDNRVGRRNKNFYEGCELRIQPLHQVHDALICQFRVEEIEWAIQRLRSYFDNEIIIAGIPITIPFEGSYGENWGNLDEGQI